MRAHAIVARRLCLVLLAGLVSTLQASAQTGLATVTGLVPTPPPRPSRA